MKNLSFLFLFLPLWLQGQVSSSMTILIDTVQKYSIVNDIAFKRFYNYSTRKARILANDLPIDTTGINVNSEIFLFYYRDKIYFNTTGNPSQKKLKYNLINKNIKSFDYIFDYDSQMIPYVVDDERMTIYLFDPETGKHTLFADFWDVASKEQGKDDSVYLIDRFFKISFINPTCAFVMLMDDYTVRYFLVNGINNKIPLSKQSILDARISDEKRTVYEIKSLSLSDGEKYIKVAYSYQTEKTKNKYIEHAACILDHNFNYIGDALLNRDFGEGMIDGVNIQDKKMQHYFLCSYTDTKDTIRGRVPHISNKSVIIPYKFNPTLELAMYKAYNNNPLTKEDIKGLEKYELGFLRNLIFAKYNYAFSSEFYQAYFNLYEFYGNESKRKIREKNVNHLLTETDKANIKWIRETETK